MDTVAHEKSLHILFGSYLCDPNLSKSVTALDYSQTTSTYSHTNTHTLHLNPPSGPVEGFS